MPSSSDFSLDLSIIIPAFNEERHIINCIENIQLAADDETSYEIIIVDNASTDATNALLSSFTGPHETIVLNQKVAIGKARNIGAQKALGNYLAFIDSDITVTKSWFTKAKQIINAPLESQSALYGYPYSLSSEPNFLERSWFGLMKLEQRSYLSGGNILCSKRTFEAIEGFHEHISTGEDVEFCNRAKLKGIKIVLDSGLEVRHEGNPKTLRTFYRRELWHGIGDFESFDTFKASRIAQLALIQNFLIVCSITGLIFLENNILPMAGIAILITINAACSKKRFYFRGLKYSITNIALHTIYLTARGNSLFKKK